MDWGMSSEAKPKLAGEVWVYRQRDLRRVYPGAPRGTNRSHTFWDLMRCGCHENILGHHWIVRKWSLSPFEKQVKRSNHSWETTFFFLASQSALEPSESSLSWWRSWREPIKRFSWIRRESYRRSRRAGRIFTLGECWELVVATCIVFGFPTLGQMDVSKQIGYPGYPQIQWAFAILEIQPTRQGDQKSCQGTKQSRRWGAPSGILSDAALLEFPATAQQRHSCCFNINLLRWFPDFRVLGCLNRQPFATTGLGSPGRGRARWCLGDLPGGQGSAEDVPAGSWTPVVRGGNSSKLGRCRFSCFFFMFLVA